MQSSIIQLPHWTTYIIRNPLYYDKITISGPFLQQLMYTSVKFNSWLQKHTILQNVKLTDCIAKPQHKHCHGTSSFSCTSADCSTMTQLAPRSQMAEAEAADRCVHDLVLQFRCWLLFLSCVVAPRLRLYFESTASTIALQQSSR